MGLAVTQHCGFGAGGSSFTSDIHQPSGTTALLRIGFASDTTTFDTNTISGAVTGTLTHNATGGAGDGGYASGWNKASNYIGCTAQDADSASSSAWLTLVGWINDTDTGSTSIGYGPRLLMFGDSAGTVRCQFGVSDGVMHMASNNTTPQGTATVADGTWHLVAFNQIAQFTWDMWVDGVKDVSAAVRADTTANANVDRVGAGYTGAGYESSISPANIDGVQIYQPPLSDAQIQEIAAAGGF